MHPLPRLKLFAAILIAGLLGLPTAARAEVFDLAGDWNSASDSSTNLWAYGTFDSSSITLSNPLGFDIPSDINYDTSAVSGLGIWFFASDAAGATGNDPNIEKNVSSSDIPGGIDWRAGKVSFGPFLGPSVAQFTVPVTGVYDISAVFTTDQTGNAPGDAEVYYGAANEFDTALADPDDAQFGTPADFTDTNVTLTAGETVDFVVGNGSKTTEVAATLTLAPEPSTFAMLAAGLLFLGFRLRRKNKRFDV